MFTNVVAVFKEFPLRHRWLAIASIQTDNLANERPFSSGAVGGISSFIWNPEVFWNIVAAWHGESAFAVRSLLFLCRADYASAGRRCRGPRELVRIGRFYYDRYSLLLLFSRGTLMASSAALTQWNTTTLCGSCVNSDSSVCGCLYGSCWDLTVAQSFTNTLHIISETYNAAMLS